MNNTMNNLDSHTHFCDVCASGAPCQTAQELATSAKFAAACAGKQYPDVSALDWTLGIIQEYGRRLAGEVIPDASEDDPEAAWTAYSEASAMIGQLRDALNSLEGTAQTEDDLLAYCTAEAARLNLPPASSYLPTTKVRTIIRRPSRFQQNRAGYEMTCSGLVMGKAILAVKQAEEEYTDLAGAVQEGARIPSDEWDVCAKRYAAARRKLDTARRKISRGETCANRAR